MEYEDILLEFKADLEAAKKDMLVAKKMISLGEKVKFDVAKRRAEIRDIETKIARFEAAIDEDLNNEHQE